MSATQPEELFQSIANINRIEDKDEFAGKYTQMLNLLKECGNISEDVASKLTEATKDNVFKLLAIIYTNNLVSND